MKEYNQTPLRINSPITMGDVLFVGMGGAVYALNKLTGVRLWRTALGGAGPVLILVEENQLYASTAGHVCRIDPTTGNLLWDNAMPGAGFGLGILATSGTSDLAAGVVAVSRATERDSQSS